MSAPLLLAPHLDRAEVLRGSGWASWADVPAPLVAAMEETARVLWTPLREAWGGPLRVVSGLRSPEANRRAGGAPGSLHLAGLALDLAPEDLGDVPRLYDMAGQLMDLGEIPPGWRCVYRHGSLSSPGAYSFCHIDRRGHEPQGGPRPDGRRTSFRKVLPVA